MESKSEKKNRLSRLLGKREKSPNPMAIDPDSAYESSETPSAEPFKDTANSTPDTVPVEKNSEMANIDQDRNLVVRPATGEVLDRDTGEVVTVVTTTTTTTTTTTRKPGQMPEVNKEVQQQIQETKPTPAPRKNLTSNTGPSEMPANPAITSSNIPDQSSSVRPLTDSPPIPTRSAARRSGEFGNRKSQASTYPGYDENMPPPTGGYYGSGAADARPDSPSRHNFSYPARNRKSMDPDGLPTTSGTGWSTTDQPQHNSKSTMGDLRAAAKGLHVC
jgi:hypothetical protein